MARETIYFVQSFNAGRGSNLKADAPIPCKSATAAVQRRSDWRRANSASLPSHPPGIRKWATMITSLRSSSAWARFLPPLTEIPVVMRAGATARARSRA